MVRIVAFALNAHEHLEMTKGLSTDDEPDIWQKSLSGEFDVWVALGLPSEKVMRQSCGKADKVIVYPYGTRTAEMWWNKIKNSTTRFDNLQVITFSETDTSALAKLASRAMKLQINIQDGDVMVSVDDSIVYVTPKNGRVLRSSRLRIAKMDMNCSVVQASVRGHSPIYASGKLNRSTDFCDHACCRPSATVEIDSTGTCLVRVAAFRSPKCLSYSHCL